MSTDFKKRLERVIRKAADFHGDIIDGNEDFFEGGFGLDSIDILEIVLGVKKEFGVEIKFEKGDNALFRNFNELSALVEQLLDQVAIENP